MYLALSLFCSSSLVLAGFLKLVILGCPCLLRRENVKYEFEAFDAQVDFSTAELCCSVIMHELGLFIK